MSMSCILTRGVARIAEVRWDENGRNTKNQWFKQNFRSNIDFMSIGLVCIFTMINTQGEKSAKKWKSTSYFTCWQLGIVIFY